MIAVSGKEKLQIKKYLDKCGQGLRRKQAAIVQLLIRPRVIQGELKTVNLQKAWLIRGLCMTLTA